MAVNTANSCCSQSTHSPVENKQLEAFDIATIQVTHQDLRPFETGIRSTAEQGGKRGRDRGLEWGVLHDTS